MVLTDAGARMTYSIDLLQKVWASSILEEQQTFIAVSSHVV